MKCENCLTVWENDEVKSRMDEWQKEVEEGRGYGMKGPEIPFTIYIYPEVKLEWCPACCGRGKES